jgi:Skp family chaperone for outer membrane proteins
MKGHPMADDRSERARQSQANAERLHDEIRSLRTQHSGVLGGVNFKEFWEHSKAVTEMFKTLKPLHPSDRERLWAEVTEIRDEMRSRQSAEREGRERVSQERRSAIMDRVHEAHHTIAGASDLDYLRRADDLLKEAQQMMKGGWNHLGGGFETAITEMFSNDGRLTKEDREFCWEHIQEQWEALKYKKEELRERDYEHGQRLAGDALNAAHYSDPYEALETIKQAQREVKGLRMGKDRSEIVWNHLQEAWDRAIARIEQHKDEKRRKHEEWADRMHANISRWEALIEKNEGVIERLEQQIAHCEDLLADARSDDFAAEVQGWINEKQDKMHDIMATNRELEDRIRDVQEKLNS